MSEEFEQSEAKRKYYYCGNCGKRLKHENANVAGYGFGRIPACTYKCQLALAKKYGEKKKPADEYMPSYSRRYVKIDDETYDKILTMRKKGYSAQEIFHTVGHSITSIYTVCNKAGLPFSKRGQEV